MLPRLGIKMSVPKMLKYFRMCDSDGSGEIDFSEFKIDLRFNSQFVPHSTPKKEIAEISLASKDFDRPQDSSIETSKPELSGRIGASKTALSVGSPALGSHFHKQKQNAPRRTSKLTKKTNVSTIKSSTARAEISIASGGKSFTTSMQGSSFASRPQNIITQDSLSTSSHSVTLHHVHRAVEHKSTKSSLIQRATLNKKSPTALP